jgi:hypothetical protein
LLNAAGCATQSEPTPEPKQTSITATPASAPVGMEVRTLLVRDDHPALAASFAKLEASALRMDPKARAKWKGSGLRVLTVPASEFSALQATLASTGNTAIAESVFSGSTSTWVNQGPRWNELVRAGTVDRPRAVAMHDARINLQPGALRLLGRCWPIADLPESSDNKSPVPAALQIELVPQNAEPRKSFDPLDASSQNPSLSLADQGLVFSRLHAGLVARADQVILILPESPARDWSKADAPAPDEPGPAPALGELAPARVPADAATKAGPPGEQVQTLGEALLMLDVAGTKSKLRAIVAIFPKPPRQYQLMAP